MTLFRVSGVPIRAHWTLLLVVPYLAFVLSTQFRAVAGLAGVDDAKLLPPLVWGLVLAVGLFASVALHEAAHTIVTQRLGGRVGSITLMLLGGVSNVTRMPPAPRQEAAIAFVGPALSLTLGAALLLLHQAAHGWPADVRMGLFYLGSANLTLGVFNLLPAFPMDGGRILRALLASRLGRVRATEVASVVGRTLAVLLGLVGLWEGALLLLLVAAFVYVGASTELTSARVTEVLGGLRAGDLVPILRQPAPTITGDALLGEALRTMREVGRSELIVTDGASGPAAVVVAIDLALVPREAWSRTHVIELAKRFGARHVTVPWETGALDALERAAEAEAAYIVVTDAMGGVMGLLTAADIQTMIGLQLAARPGREAPRPHDATTLHT